MDLLVVRHAIAMERDDYAAISANDDGRPLTDTGARRMARVANGLRALVERIDVLASSPLVRARQTAQIVADAYGIHDVLILDALRPENAPEDLLDWAKEVEHPDVCAIVGHEPHLGELVTWLMTGADESHVTLKKGGACLLTFDDRVAKGEGILRWLLTPSQLIASSM